jgi:hypothetical protein
VALREEVTVLDTVSVLGESGAEKGMLRVVGGGSVAEVCVGSFLIVLAGEKKDRHWNVFLFNYYKSY